MLRITYSPRLSTALSTAQSTVPFLPPLLPESVWTSAKQDLDRLHTTVTNPSYYNGYTYWIASKEMVQDQQLIHVDYQLIYYTTGWISSCVCYYQDEDSPEPWMTEYVEEQKEEDQKEQEDQKDEEKEPIYQEYENFCFTCQSDTDRTCCECGISICDRCSPGRNLCPHCVSDYLETF